MHSIWCNANIQVMVGLIKDKKIRVYYEGVLSFKNQVVVKYENINLADLW